MNTAMMTVYTVLLVVTISFTVFLLLSDSRHLRPAMQTSGRLNLIHEEEARRLMGDGKYAEMIPCEIPIHKPISNHK